MHEAAAAFAWLRDEASAATGIDFYGDNPPMSAGYPRGAVTLNRDRTVRHTPLHRAWSADTWQVKVVDNDPAGTRSRELADALDARLEGQLNIAGPFGTLIVSCLRDSLVFYEEARTDGGVLLHRGGLYTVRIQGPQ